MCIYRYLLEHMVFFLFYEGKSIFHCRALMKIHKIMYNSINISVSILQPVLYSYFVFTFLFCTQCHCVKQIYNTIYIKIMFDIGKVYMFIVWLLCFITLYRYLFLNHIFIAFKSSKLTIKLLTHDMKSYFIFLIRF